jgi:predicted HTH transcriptional regulator
MEIAMLTNVTDTSLDAFADLKQSSTLQEQQRKIISVMQPEHTYTRRALAALARLETSTASARINSLLDTHIVVVGKTKDPLTRKTVEALQLKVA